MIKNAWLSEARTEFHSTILAGILTKNDKGIPSNADTGSKISVALACAILDQLGVARTAAKLPGQTADADFEDVTATFADCALN